jgi:septum formation protein
VQLILASASPRRAELLAVAGIPVRVDAAELDETLRPDEPPAAYVLRLAVAKAQAGVRRNPGSLVIGADTTVVVDDRMLGKPADAEEATEMLKLLAGRTHSVLTGVAVADGRQERSAIARTEVRFLPLSPGEVAWYVSTGEPFGKAGAYAIQGRASRFVESIDGSYSNVVGLPVSVTYQLLRSCGWRQAPEEVPA